MTRPRDNQRQRVYSAERASRSKCCGREYGQTIKNANLQPFVDKVMAKATIKGRWPNNGRVKVLLSRGGGRAYYWSNEIHLGVDARNEWYILHEIAHLLTPTGVAAHGPEFVGVLTFLIHTVLGKEAADTFKAECKTRRVRRNTKALPAPADRTEKVMQERLDKIKIERNAAAARLAEIETRLRAAQVEIRTYRQSKREKAAA